MPETPEAQARQEIDRLLTAVGWHVCGVKDANIHAARGVAIREFELASNHGTADYLLYVDGKAAGVIEAKKVGATLTGVEVQSGRYAKGLPPSLPAWCRPLPFVYESTGLETHFTNGLDLDAKARNIFAFHRPEMLAEWLAPLSLGRGAGGEGLAHFLSLPLPTIRPGHCAAAPSDGGRRGSMQSWFASWFDDIGSKEQLTFRCRIPP